MNIHSLQMSLYDDRKHEDINNLYKLNYVNTH